LGWTIRVDDQVLQLSDDTETMILTRLAVRKPTESTRRQPLRKSGACAPAAGLGAVSSSVVQERLGDRLGNPKIRRMDRMANDARVAINSTVDIVNARQEGRALAQRLGFAGSQVTLIAAAISEVARNIVDYAQCGEIILAGVQSGPRRGIKIIARDHGPGIPNLARAMEYGFSTRRRAGAGLPGAKWLMDEFDIQSKVGKGTVVTMKKWTAPFGKPE
jgi:serine/threonine-protein kinase RsbT